MSYLKVLVYTYCSEQTKCKINYWWDHLKKKKKNFFVKMILLLIIADVHLILKRQYLTALYYLG